MTEADYLTAVRDQERQHTRWQGPISVKEGAEPVANYIAAARIFAHLDRRNLPESEARAIALDLGRHQPWGRWPEGRPARE